MSALKVKTRRNTSPQGKPRIWFCAHASECGELIDVISEEILERQNCAIYYDAEPEGEWNAGTLTDDLAEMNMFVMAVTKKLLTTPNRALDVEFAYAIEHHIPVLPLMQEDGLVELFNEKCGELQFLYKGENDATAISYGEKLDAYLSSVLIGDGLAKQVREAFDAYIFLSYRKKDRKYAQRLMRLIHENEFCRDVAIWYDEFLTPGENFNDSISEILKKSKLFAMAVTPNLVNEENYVMTVEYPEAIKAKKPILVAEMVHTDAEALKNSYKDLPEVTDAENGNALSCALKNALENIALRENDTDPRHNFFIGLAYLGGIDVEIDHKRALSLIEGAADAGLTEAMEKLVSMYRIGEGVPRDYIKAIQWQERLVASLRAVFNETMREKDGISYLLAVEVLGKYYSELEKYSEAKTMYEDVQSSLKRLSGKESVKLKNAWFLYYLELGSIDIDRGKPDEAEKVCRNVKKALLANAFGMIPPLYWGLYGKCSSLMGDVCLQRGESKKALKHYKRSFKISELFFKLYSSTETRSSLIIDHSKLANAYKALGDNVSAAKYYAKSEKLSQSGESEDVSADPRATQAYNEGNLGDVACKEKDWDAAIRHYSLSLQLREELLKETGGVTYREDIATLYARLGELESQRKNTDKAREYYLKCLEQREIVKKETNTAESKRRIASVCQLLGDDAAKQGDIAGAREYLERSRSAAVDAINSTKYKSEYFGTLASVDLSIAALHGKTGDSEGEHSSYKRAAELLEPLVYQQKYKSYCQNLAFAYFKLGYFAYDRDDYEKAEYYYKRCADLREKIVKEDPVIERRSELANVYSHLGSNYRDMKKYIEARRFYGKSAKLRVEIYNEAHSSSNGFVLARTYINIGSIERFHGSRDEAKRLFLDAIALCEGIAEHDRSEHALRELNYAYDALAMISVENGWCELVTPYLLKQASLSLYLEKQTGKEDHLLGAATAYERLTKLAAMQGDAEAKAEYTAKNEAVVAEWKERGVQREYNMALHAVMNAEEMPREMRRKLLQNAYESCEYLVTCHEHHAQHAEFLQLFEKIKRLMEEE